MQTQTQNQTQTQTETLVQPQTGIFTLNWKQVLGAVASSVIMAVLMYLSNLTQISDLSLRTIAFVALGAGVGSLIKVFNTTDQGKLGGVVPVANATVPTTEILTTVN